MKMKNEKYYQDDSITVTIRSDIFTSCGFTLRIGKVGAGRERIVVAKNDFEQLTPTTYEHTIVNPNLDVGSYTAEIELHDPISDTRKRVQYSAIEILPKIKNCKQ